MEVKKKRQGRGKMMCSLGDEEPIVSQWAEAGDWPLNGEDSCGLGCGKRWFSKDRLLSG